MGWLLRMGLIWVLLSTPAQAFVSKIHPNDANTGPIPCHILRAVFNLYIDGVYTAGQLSNTLQAHYGFTWSSEDDTDNTNILTLINAQGTTAAKRMIAERLEDICFAWEEGFTEVDTKNEYRTIVGIATQ